MNSFFEVSSARNFTLITLDHVKEADLQSVAPDSLGFVINYVNDEQAQSALQFIRQHENPNIYLRPVILVHAEELNPGLVAKRFDYQSTHHDFTDNALFKLISKFEKTNSWIAKLPNNDNMLSDTRLRFRVLRLMTSRFTRHQPISTIHNKRGFEYSLLTPLLNESDGSIEQVLAFLQSQQLLKDEFVKKAHFCPHCDSAFLNFKETCPDCGSDNLLIDELIHHFKCGHTDVNSAFRIQNRLKCPKCEDELKHIGVDYDKPSTVCTCVSCRRTFQDPEVKAECFACHRTVATDDLDLRTISEYTVSAMGASAARYGLDALFTSTLQTDLKLYSNEEVNHFVYIEKARIERYKKSESSLAIIHFANLDDLFATLGRKTAQVFKEISAVFKSEFRDSDLITAKNESLYAVIMTETSSHNATQAIERLNESIKALFAESLDFTLQINSHISNIMDINDINDVINQFVQVKE